MRIYAFRGDRGQLAAAFLRALDDEKNRGGPSPTALDCQLITGHVGVSTNLGQAIYGFNLIAPVGVPVWQLMNRLRNGEAFAGVVRDDTAVFSAALAFGLAVYSFDVILPEPDFLAFEGSLNNERLNPRFTYGFPDGDGECNCATWLERLGLPLLTGRMDELVGVSGISRRASRRFGHCN